MLYKVAAAICDLPRSSRVFLLVVSGLVGILVLVLASIVLFDTHPSFFSFSLMNL